MYYCIFNLCYCVCHCFTTVRQAFLLCWRWCCHFDLCQQAQVRDWGKPTLARDGEAECDQPQLAVNEIPLQSTTGKVWGCEGGNNRRRHQASREQNQGNPSRVCLPIFLCWNATVQQTSLNQFQLYFVCLLKHVYKIWGTFFRTSSHRQPTINMSK